MADRAVSAVLGYVLTLGIVTVLISGLFLAAGGFVETEHERVIRSEFEVVGNRIAADIAAMDRLALAAGPTGQASLLTDLPSRAAGSTYLISVSEVPGTDTRYRLNLTATALDLTVTVQVKSQTELVQNRVSGGDVRIVFNGTHLEVRDA